jgi:hypothetical protein
MPRTALGLPQVPALALSVIACKTTSNGDIRAMFGATCATT